MSYLNQTPNFGFPQYALGDIVDPVADWNKAWETVDTELQKDKEGIAKLPAMQESIAVNKQNIVQAQNKADSAYNMAVRTYPMKNYGVSIYTIDDGVTRIVRNNEPIPELNNLKIPADLYLTKLPLPSGLNPYSLTLTNAEEILGHASPLPSNGDMGIIQVYVNSTFNIFNHKTQTTSLGTFSLVDIQYEWNFSNNAYKASSPEIGNYLPILSSTVYGMIYIEDLVRGNLTLDGYSYQPIYNFICLE